MKKNIVSVLLITALLAVGVVGCGSNDASGGNDGSSGTEGEKVTLTFSHMFAEGESGYETIATSVEQFNAENENAEVIIENMPQDAYLTQIQARATADDLSEMLMVNGTMSKSFSDIGAIIPITDFVEENGITEKLLDGLFTEHTNIDDGEVYSIPTSSGIYGFIIYNSRIFEEVGIESFPETLEEFQEACDKLIDAGYTPMGLGMKDQWAGDSILFSSFVNNFVGNEWYQGIRQHDGSASYTDPEFVAALAAYQELAQNGVFNEDFVSISNDERLALYMNEDVAMISAGDWEINNIINANADFEEISKLAYWPGPSEDAKADNSIVKSAAWGIAFGSKITDEQMAVAEKYLNEYLLTNEIQRIQIEEYYKLPSLILEEFDETKLTIPTVDMLELAELGTGCMNYDSSLDPTVKEIYQRGLQELLMGTITPEDLAQQMQAEYDML